MFTFTKFKIPDLLLVEPRVIKDERGYFLEAYKHSEFAEMGINDVFVQDNQSLSSKGVLRGLHYQKTPKAQAKLLRCISGEIFDVAVDIRKNSPTYGEWAGVTLSSENKKMLYIPEGFAHGFLVLSDSAEILYKVTNEYSPEDDRGIKWDDPEININWGTDNLNPIISPKDQNHPCLNDADNNFMYVKKN